MAQTNTAKLRPVDKLVIRFLVDDSIEWMTALPPGFSHEMRGHLENYPGGDDTIGHGLPVLDFNTFCCGAHGFSSLIETHIAGEEVGSVLFDTGPNSTTLRDNIRSLKIDPAKIETLVLSHWHVDHSGGILSFLEQRALAASGTPDIKPIVLDLHPDRPRARGIAPPPGDKVVAALAEDPSFQEMEDLGGVVFKSKEGHTVNGSTVYVSGEIPRVSGFETGLIGARTWVVDASGDGSWIQDEDIMDERYAAIDVAGKGLVVFSACSHAGIVNVLKDAIAKLQRPIYMVIGGLHLAGPELLPRIQPTIDFLKQLEPQPAFILPMHCSGFQCKVALRNAFGDAIVPAGVGMKVVVE